ncbi:MAG: fatty acid desaturase [Thermaceae bacterium]
MDKKPLEPKDWIPLIKPYAKPNVWRSLQQVANTVLPLFTLFFLAHKALEVSLALTLVLDALAALFLVRLFILQHDAGHGSFFSKRWANDLLGFISGILTLVPYHYWQASHARHHATSGNLDKRGVGDIYTMTVQEYLEATPWERFKYRVYRNPWIMFLIGPIYVFMLSYRFPTGYGSDKPHLRNSVAWTNLGIALLLAGIVLAFGVNTLLYVYLPIVYLAGMAGISLFYVQHQFEDAYWEHDPRWEYLKAAMEGSTYLKLPKILQWLTGNIGFHHIHHLAPKIPNYNLEKVQEEVDLVKVAPTVTLWDAFKIAFTDMHLHDEQSRKLVGFKDVVPLLRQKKEGLGARARKYP